MTHRLLALIALPLAAAAGPAAADQGVVQNGHTFKLGSFTAASGERIRVAADEVWEGNAYLAAGEIDVDGRVSGDLFTGSGRLELGGRVDQDLAAGGGNLIINGEIGGDARLTAGDARIDGVIEGELLYFGGVLIVGPSAVIRGPAVIYAGQVILEGTLEQGAEIGSGQVRIDGTIGGNVRVQSDELTFGPLSRIEGNLDYATRSAVDVPDGAVTGTVTKSVRPEKTDWDETIDVTRRKLGAFGMFKTALNVFLALVGLLAGILMLLFFRPFVDGALDRAWGGSAVGVSFGVGLVAVLVMLVFGILCIWLVPLSLAMWSGFGALLYFGGVLGKMALGRVTLFPLMRRAAHPLLALLVGLALMFALGFVPFVGEIVWWLVTITGIGMALLQIRGGHEAAEEILAPGPPAAPPEAPTATTTT